MYLAQNERNYWHNTRKYGQDSFNGYLCKGSLYITILPHCKVNEKYLKIVNTLYSNQINKKYNSIIKS